MNRRKPEESTNPLCCRSLSEGATVWGKQFLAYHKKRAFKQGELLDDRGITKGRLWSSAIDVDSHPERRVHKHGGLQEAGLAWNACQSREPMDLQKRRAVSCLQTGFSQWNCLNKLKRPCLKVLTSLTLLIKHSTFLTELFFSDVYLKR